MGREVNWDVEYVGGVYWSKEIMADMGRREKEWRARVEAKLECPAYEQTRRHPSDKREHSDNARGSGRISLASAKSIQRGLCPLRQRT